MPHMSGFQVCKRLKSDPKTKDIQILMVTALNELGDIEQATECGTDDFVSKPVNKFELLTRVKSLLRVRHLKGSGAGPDLPERDRAGRRERAHEPRRATRASGRPMRRASPRIPPRQGTDP